MDIGLFRECVEIEKERQRVKGRTSLNDDKTWSVILAEECGEVANAVLSDAFVPDEDYKPEIIEELVQCAAVIEAWVRQRDFDPGIIEIMRSKLDAEHAAFSTTIEPSEPPQDEPTHYIG